MSYCYLQLKKMSPSWGLFRRPPVPHGLLSYLYSSRIALLTYIVKRYGKLQSLSISPALSSTSEYFVRS